MEDSWFNPVSLFSFNTEEDVQKQERTSMSEARGSAHVTRAKKPPPPALSLSDDSSQKPQQSQRKPPLHNSNRKTRDNKSHMSREESFKAKASKPMLSGSGNSSRSRSEQTATDRRGPSRDREEVSRPMISPLVNSVNNSSGFRRSNKAEEVAPSSPRPPPSSPRPPKLRVRTLPNSSTAPILSSPLTLTSSFRQGFARVLKALSTKETPTSPASSVSSSRASSSSLRSQSIKEVSDSSDDELNLDPPSSPQNDEFASTSTAAKRKNSTKRPSPSPRQRNFPFFQQSKDVANTSRQRKYSSVPRTRNDLAQAQDNADQIRQIVVARKQEQFERSMSRNREADSIQRESRRNGGVVGRSNPVFNTKLSNELKSRTDNQARRSAETPDISFDGFMYLSRPEIDRKSLKIASTLDDRHSKRCVRCVSWRGEKFAFKISARGTNDSRAGRILIEKEIMMSMDSTWHTKLVNTYMNDKNLFMLIEYAPNKSLDLYIDPKRGLGENAGSTAGFYIAGVLNGIEYMHSRGIIHRDIKAANVLINARGYPLICDYGLSKFLSQGERTATILGTMQYIAPEMLGSSGYDHGVDVWSLGITFYELIFGTTPFEPEEPNLVEENWMEQVRKNIKSSTLHFPNERVGLAGRLLMKQLLERRVEDRLGFSSNGVWNFDTIRDHSFFSNQIDWRKLESRKIQPPKLKLYKKIDNIFDL